MRRLVRLTILTLMMAGTAAMLWARPWAWRPIHQATTGRVLYRAWLGPWRPSALDIAEPAGSVDRLVLDGVRLPQANLRSWRLSNVDFADTDLAWANGDRMTIWYSRLANVRLVAAKLDHARLSHVSITNSSLRAVQARGAYIVNSELTAVDLRDADLRGAAFQQTLLRGRLDLRGADLRGATFADVDLRPARLEGARLEGAQWLGNVKWPTGFDPASRGVRDMTAEQTRRLPSARQRWSLPPGSATAVLTGLRPSADLTGHQFFGADLSRARLRGASLRQAVLCFGSLRQADLRETDLSGADLTGTDLTGADLTGARLDGTVLSHCRWDSRTRWPKGFEPPRQVDSDGGSLSITQDSINTASWMIAQTP